MSSRFRDDQPIFQQIAEMIESNIIEGSININDRIPSTNELAKHYQINPATAAKGINLLVDEGVIYKKRGVGMFVTENARDVVIKKRKDIFYEQYISPLLNEANRIEISTQQIMNWIKEGKENGN
ncbi:GntR family transcriptional regulator [Saliterribacillus persicus]|uniref:DNA-binding transcriptional regulator YhcF (GntR family) n=1 Tax=Saliterribacillus persicus TaxID=930114 RepID=A0A368Y537_9BACI|nr:GntR family transcriptional regulator [Saliterribacillus persicus]RCW74859.1 DNA-binding transcriptional regulator YhcF (GntR family) [Saliterribacillus persicus]